MNENIWTEKEIAEEVDKLIKYMLEMQAVTRYKKDDKFNVQKLIKWSYDIKYKEVKND